MLKTLFSFASAPAFSYFCEVKVDDMIDIACCIDSNYAKYCCVMLTSLLENNKGEQVPFMCWEIGWMLIIEDLFKNLWKSGMDSRYIFMR